MDEKNSKQSFEFLSLENAIGKTGFYSPEGTFAVCNPDGMEACADSLLRTNNVYFSNLPSTMLFTRNDNMPADTQNLSKVEQLKAHGYVGITGSQLSIVTPLSGLQYHELMRLGFKVPIEHQHNYAQAFGWDKIDPKSLITNTDAPVIELFRELLDDPFNGVETKSLEEAKKLITLLAKITITDTTIQNTYEEDRSTNIYLDPTHKYCLIISARLEHLSYTDLVIKIKTCPLADLERDESMVQHIRQNE